MTNNFIILLSAVLFNEKNLVMLFLRFIIKYNLCLWFKMNHHTEQFYETYMAGKKER